MKKYLIIKRVFAQEILGDLHEILLDRYEAAGREIEAYAAALGAEVFFEDVVNCCCDVGRSFACVEHNFALTAAEKDKIVAMLSVFFEDGEIRGKTMRRFNTLSAVRFLLTDGELLAPRP